MNTKRVLQFIIALTILHIIPVNTYAVDKWKIKNIKEKFKSCKDAEDFVNTGADIGEADAKIRPKLGKTTFSKQSDGSFIAEVEVNWSLNPNSVMSLPAWTWGKKMTKGDKAAFMDFRGKLQAHEEGHMIIAEDYAKEITGITLKASGTTKEKAKEELQNELKNYRQELQNTLDERRIAYDQKTDHGRKQSEVGGEDVRLACAGAGWSGTVSYTVFGNTPLDTSGVLADGTVTWTENTTVEVSGHGKLQMAEERPGSMLVIGGSGDWTDSSVKTRHVIRTERFGNGTSCVYDTTDTGQTLLEGMADQPTTSLSFIVTGNAYKIQVPSLGGMLSGTSTSSLTGTVSGPCGPPLTHSSTPSPASGSIPVHDLEIDGAIDPNTPNAIKGSKKTPVSESANRNYVYEITWEFNR